MSATGETSQQRVYRQRHTGWIATDLDGTLATYDHWRGEDHIGEPILPMVQRVKRYLEEGYEVRIFTARVYDDGGKRDVARVREVIEKWCLKHIGCVLPAWERKSHAHCSNIRRTLPRVWSS